jgi:hypothetical protein
MTVAKFEMIRSMVIMRRIQRNDFGVELRVVVNINSLLLAFRRIRWTPVKRRERDPRDAFGKRLLITFASLGQRTQESILRISFQNRVTEAAGRSTPYL